MKIFLKINYDSVTDHKFYLCFGAKDQIYLSKLKCDNNALFCKYAITFMFNSLSLFNQNDFRSISKSPKDDVSFLKSEQSEKRKYVVPLIYVDFQYVFSDWKNLSK